MSLKRFPHCDQAILYAPGECEFCDMRSEWQELRVAWGVAFTGHLAGEDGAIVPCPADVARPNAAHQHWPGNRPEGH